MPDGDLVTHRKRTVPKGGYALIERLSAEGAREADVARALNVSPATWSRIRRRDAKAEAAFEAGRGKLYKALVARLLFPKLPDAGSTNEKIAIMRAQHHGTLCALNSLFWQPNAALQAGGKLQVEIRLPGPMTLAEYRAKAIPADPSDAEALAALTEQPNEAADNG